MGAKWEDERVGCAGTESWACSGDGARVIKGVSGASCISDWYGSARRFLVQGRETACLLQPFTGSGWAQVLRSAPFTQHQGAVGAALLPIVDGLPGGIAGTAGRCGPGGNVIKSFSHPGRGDRTRSAWGRTLNGVRLECVREKSESVEIIMAVGCCLHGNLLSRALLHWVDHLGTFKVGIPSPLMPWRIYLEPMMPLMMWLLAHSRRTVMIVFALHFLGILHMSKVITRACHVAVPMLAEIRASGNVYQAVSRTNRESPVPVVVAATQNSTRFLRTQFEHGTATQYNFSSWMIYTRVSIPHGLTLPVTLHLQPTTFWTGNIKSARWRHHFSPRKHGPTGRLTCTTVTRPLLPLLARPCTFVSLIVMRPILSAGAAHDVVRCNEFVRPCRSFPLRGREVKSDRESDRSWARPSCAEKPCSRARSDFVVLSKPTPQCPRAKSVVWYCTLTRINYPRSTIRYWDPSSTGHRTSQASKIAGHHEQNEYMPEYFARWGSYPMQVTYSRP